MGRDTICKYESERKPNFRHIHKKCQKKEKKKKIAIHWNQKRQ